MTETKTSIEFDYVPTTSTITEQIVYSDITTDNLSTICLGEWQGVWYTAVDMGYNCQPYGASGNQLISGYSVACDNLPFGTRLLVECEYFTKEVKVDDCGVGSSNVLDLYYFDRSEIPSELLQAGRMPITVSVIN